MIAFIWRLYSQASAERIYYVYTHTKHYNLLITIRGCRLSVITTGNKL